MELNEELFLTASSKKHDCVTAIFVPEKLARISPEQRASSINQLERDVHAVKVGKARTWDW